MDSNLSTLSDVIESMPLYGELRKINEHLKFGQYLTGLEEWLNRVRREEEKIIIELRHRVSEIRSQTPPNPSKDATDLYKLIEEVIG